MALVPAALRKYSVAKSKQRIFYSAHTTKKSLALFNDDLKIFEFSVPNDKDQNNGTAIKNRSQVLTSPPRLFRT